MTERHKDIVRQVRDLGEYPIIHAQQTPQMCTVAVVSTERAFPGQTIAAIFNIDDLLAIVRGVDIGGDYNDHDTD